MGAEISESNKIANLPPVNTKRWVKSRKLAVVQAIADGVLSEQAALDRYGLSVEELNSWKHLLECYGPDALRTTHLKEYRNKDIAEQNFLLPTMPETGMHS